MPDLSPLGADTRGIWTRREALALLSAGAVRERLESGEWQVVWPGRYADGGGRLDAGQRAAAVVLGRRGAVAAGRTAARWWGMPLIDDDDPATGSRQRDEDDVAALNTRTRTHAQESAVPDEWRATTTVDQVRVVHERRLRLGPHDIVNTGFCSVLTPLATIVDCARVLTHEALVCAIDHSLHHALVSSEELEEASDRVSGRGKPELRHAVELADGRAESPLETLGRLLLKPVLPGLVPQVEVLDRARRLVARLDLADEVVKFGIEADGRGSHSKPKQVSKDVHRNHRVSGFGWGPLSRYGWWEARCQPAVLKARIVTEYERWERLQAA